MLELLWDKVGRMAVIIGTFLCAFTTIALKLKSMGRKEQRNTQLELELKDAKKVRSIRNEVRRVRDTDLDHRLDRWLRD